MTGYNAALTGVFDYADGKPSDIKPIANLSYPRMIVYDGSRIGLQDMTAYSSDEVPFHTITHTENTFDIVELLEDSRNFKEPLGILVDCK